MTCAASYLSRRFVPTATILLLLTATSAILTADGGLIIVPPATSRSILSRAGMPRQAPATAIAIPTIRRSGIEWLSVERRLNLYPSTTNCNHRLSDRHDRHLVLHFARGNGQTHTGSTTGDVGHDHRSADGGEPSLLSTIEP